jgi:protein phosphatase 1L
MTVSVESPSVTTSYKKATLKLNIRQINYLAKLNRTSPKPVATWKDRVVLGDQFGVALKKGCLRQTMEDAYSVCRGLRGLEGVDAFAVFDGHGGSRAALYAAKHLIKSIKGLDNEGLRQAFLVTDAAYCAQSKGHKDGTTALVALLSQLDLYCGSVGDSKALLVTEVSQRALSTEHLASNPTEQQRIEASGGYVLYAGGIQRVQGTLALSRSIGDPAFKEYLIAEPSLVKHSVHASDIALVLASDGLYAVMSDAEIAVTVRSLQHCSMHVVAEALACKATELGSRDNVTVLVVDLKTLYSQRSPLQQTHKPKLPLATPKAKQSRGLFSF